MRSSKEAREAEFQKAQSRYMSRQALGAALTREAHQLREITDREKLLETATELFRRIQDDAREVRDAIQHKSSYAFGEAEESLKEGDMYTFLAEDIAGMMRENVCNPQTIWESLSDALPEVHFTVDWYDGVAMVAAMLREARQLGVIDGLELANAADARINAPNR